MAEVLRLLVDRTPTPIGELMVVADGEGRLRATHWTDHQSDLGGLLRRQYGEQGFTLEPAANPGGLTAAVAAYFEGDLTAIDALPVELVGTPFQRENDPFAEPANSENFLSLCRADRRIERSQNKRTANADFLNRLI